MSAHAYTHNNIGTNVVQNYPNLLNNNTALHEGVPRVVDQYGTCISLYSNVRSEKKNDNNVLAVAVHRERKSKHR